MNPIEASGSTTLKTLVRKDTYQQRVHEDSDNIVEFVRYVNLGAFDLEHDTSDADVIAFFELNSVIPEPSPALSEYFFVDTWVGDDPMWAALECQL